MEYVTLAIRLLIRHEFKACNRYTTGPLVINQAQLDWHRQEGFSCKRIEEHKQERINTNLKLQLCMKRKSKWGSRTRFQRTNRHSGGDQEQGPWINVQGLVATDTTLQCLFLKGKLKTKQNPSLSGGGYWVYRRTRWPRVGATRGGRPQLGLKARHDTRPTWPKTCDAAPYRGHTKWSTMLR